MSNLVIIKPIERKRCLGDGGEKYFKRPLYIEALKDENGNYNVGLSKEEREDLQKHFAYSLDPIFKADDMNSIWNRDEGRFIMTYQTHVLDLDKPLDRLRYGLVKASFVRIGINIKLGFIHVDEDPNKPKAFFKY